MSKPIDQEMPCPFCGGCKTEVCHDDGLAWTRCKSCGATGPALTKYSGEEGEPCTDWNSRAAVQPAGVAEQKLQRTIDSLHNSHAEVLWKVSRSMARQKMAIVEARALFSLIDVYGLDAVVCPSGLSIRERLKTFLSATAQYAEVKS